MSVDVSQRPVLTLRLFGPMQVLVGQAPLPPLRSRKGEGLLALLALRGTPLSRSWLAGTLWPESDESRALLYLRRELMYLRKALGSASDCLLVVGQTLQLASVGVDCDLASFDTALRSNDERALERAVALYRGPLLQGCDDAWVQPERRAREQAYCEACERLAEAAAARSEFAAAVRHLRAVVAQDPLRESAQRALMSALAASGDTAAAIQVYRELRLYLHRELNAEADVTTIALYQQLRTPTPLRQPPATELPHPRDLSRLPTLPIPLTPLIGRDHDLVAARQALMQGRLVTLLGTGGVGKTRLAIELGQQLQDAFADGVCFIELAATHDPARVCQSVMEAFRLKPARDRTDLESLMERLRWSAPLLILDNCEHLLAPCAQLVGALLRSCPALQVLTTSREPLGLVGETLWRVPSLSVPPVTGAGDLLAQARSYEAIRLFVERAQQAHPDFTLTTATVDAVARICRRLDGIPLAIELAAARLRSLSVEDLDRKLDQRFHVLTSGARTALSRHQTLRSLIDWSFDLLTAPERALFARLSVFSGGWTIDAAEQVCAGGDLTHGEILDLLASLCDKSLVVAETADRWTRYRMLETIRHYAADRLADTDTPAQWQNRHLDHYLDWVERAVPQLIGPEQRQWFAVLSADQENFRTALTWSLEHPQRGESSLRLASALWWFWHVRGNYAEARQWCERALRHTDSQPLSVARGGVLHGAAATARLQGDYRIARRYFEESLAVRQALGDHRGVAHALHGIGFVAADQGELDAAQPVLLESLQRHRANDDLWGTALVLNRLGLLHHESGDYPTAHRYYEESLALGRTIGDRWGIANFLTSLGNLHYNQGNYPAAQSVLEESLSLQREIDNQTGMGMSLVTLARIAGKQRDFPAAHRALHEATQIARNTADQKRSCEVLEVWAGVAAAEHQWVRAATLLGAAAALRVRIGSPIAPNERMDYDAQVETIRAALGGEPTFSASWNAGQALRWEQALGLALVDVTRPDRPPDG